MCFSSSLFIFVKYDVPKELILGSTLFKIFLCDIFVIVIDIDIASYDDDNTRYCTNDVPEDLKITLKTVSVNLFQRFYKNGMKADIGNFSLQNLDSQKLLTVMTDRNLSLNENASNLCKMKYMKDFH